MVLPNEATKILNAKFPGFSKTEYWENFKSIKYGVEEEAIKFHGVMTAFTDYVTDLLNSKETNNAEKQNVFLLIEEFICNGDNSVKGAASASFLENLINYIAWGDLNSEQFIHYLGEKSKKFCKKWDEFTGVPTPGLWKKGEFKGQRNPVDGWL